MDPDGDKCISQSVIETSMSLVVVHGKAEAARVDGSVNNVTDDGDDEVLTVEESSQASDPPQIDFLKDDPKDMTFSRRIALHLMRKYKWYNPKLDLDRDDTALNNTAVTSESEEAPTVNVSSRTTKAEKPSLEKAWAFFEHVTLRRRLLAREDDDEDNKTNVQKAIGFFHKGSNRALDIAEPGESTRATKLYSPVTTPLNQMGDFGLGFGLYFFTLRSLAILSLLLGLINIPNLLYFSGSEYSDGQQGVASLSKGSAICTSQKWVPCPTCTEGQFSGGVRSLYPVFREIDGVGDTSNDIYPFVKRNDCDGATLQQGFVNYATLFVAILGTGIIFFVQHKREVQFDEDEQTAQDYSILVRNPPADAYEPEEWKAFFEDKGGHVTCCTVDVDNDLIVKALVDRRECMRKLEMMLPSGSSLDAASLEETAMKIKQERTRKGRYLARVAPGIPELVDRLSSLTSNVKELTEKAPFPTTNVFVTFETEWSQRKVLSTFSAVATLNAMRNDTRAVADQNLLFRGSHVLEIEEPEEPSTIRWQDLNVKRLTLFRQFLMTIIVLAISVVVTYIIILCCYSVNAWFGSIITTVCTSLFPVVSGVLTKTESHYSESTRQKWLYFKSGAYNVAVTSVLLQIITPFTATLDNREGSVPGLISAVQGLFFSQLAITPALQIADIAGHINRHILAPRAATQDAMNLKMQGAGVQLYTRYANMTKFVFLMLWYCAIFPGGFFMGSFALFIAYFTDRFCLMRSWGRSPQLGAQLAHFGRDFFFPVAVLAMAVVSNYAWSGFSYDNLCEDTETPLDPYYVGEWEPDIPDQKITMRLFGKNIPLHTVPGSNATFQILEDATVYRYCNQDLRATSGKSFPALSKFQPEGGEWMTADQETVTNVYGWTVVGVLALVCLWFLWRLVKAIQGYFLGGTYTPRGKAMYIHFSEVEQIDAYVPQVPSPMFEHPLIVCDTRDVDDDKLFSWKDPYRPYSYYDVTKDAEEILLQEKGTDGDDLSGLHLFSKIAHWHPAKNVGTRMDL